MTSSGRMIRTKSYQPTTRKWPILNIRAETIKLSFFTTALAVGLTADGWAQTPDPPTLRVGALPAIGMVIDGALDEPAWTTTEAVDSFTQADPDEDMAPTLRTIVRVLAGPKGLLVGIVCEDSDPDGIVTFSVRRDAPLDAEDHVRVVVGPFLDGAASDFRMPSESDGLNIAEA